MDSHRVFRDETRSRNLPWMMIKEIIDKIQRLDRLMSHGVKTLSVIHLDKYKANRQKKQDLINLLKSKGYK